MTRTDGMDDIHGPSWWRTSKVWWFIVIAAASILLLVVVIEKAGKPAPTPYSTFLDQLEAGNVASVTFQGTEIDGRYKHSLDSTPPGGTARRDTFSSRVPDFGDPALVAELRRQHVVIVVNPPSQWTSLFARMPWPMLLFFGAVAIAGLVKLLRGGKARSGSTVSAFPAHGMMGLVSGLFAKQRQAASPPTDDGDEPKSR